MMSFDLYRLLGVGYRDRDFFSQASLFDCLLGVPWLERWLTPTLRPYAVCVASTHALLFDSV